MPIFYIEMGQGIVAKGDFAVSTSSLSTCTFIVGYNKDTKQAGAFHYPGGALQNEDGEVEMDLNKWMMKLDPLEIFLTSGSTPQLQDLVELIDWFKDFKIVPKETKPCFHPIMRINAEKIEVEINFIDPKGFAHIIRVEKQKNGDYSNTGFQYTLFGKDRN